MNMTAIVITAIICAALVAIFWIDSKKGGTQK
jgi:hypothetical protein